MNADPDFDALLGEALAPPVRPPDRIFVARTEAMVAEAARFERWRRRALRQFASEVLVVGALAAAAVTVARAPLAQTMLSQAPFVAPVAIALALVTWAALATRGGRTLA
jgi:hypothetical protein